MADLKPIQWEYRLESFGGLMKRTPSAEDLTDTLNEWGEAGWEVVAAVYSDSASRWSILAKRPLTGAEKRRRSMPGTDAFLG
jgi:hypothetical protein